MISFIAKTWVDASPGCATFPRSPSHPFPPRKIAQVTLQDQINPVRWVALNIVVSRPNYDRRTLADTSDNGGFNDAGAETHLSNQSRNNYRVGAVLLPQENWVGWSRGFRPYFSYNSSFNPVTQVPLDGSQLVPVINKSWEVGTSWKGLKDRLTITTAARRIQDQNRVVTITTGVFEQVGKASTYNMDLDINGNLGRGFYLIANYAYADSLIDRFRTDGVLQTNGGKRFPHAPKHISRIWVTKSFNVSDNSRLNFSLGGRYQRHYFTNTANTTIVPSLTTFDGAVTLTRPKYDVGVNFTNLLNAQRYFTSVINGSQLYPGPPIAATLTVRYRF